MKALIVTALILLGLTGVCFSQSERTFHSIVVRDEAPAMRNTFVVDYDCGFAWVGQHFGDQRDFGGNTPAGVFVHSKTHDHWLQILRVSTIGAKFGKSPPDARLQAPWDFTALISKQFVPLPIPTAGAIHLRRFFLTTQSAANASTQSVASARSTDDVHKFAAH